MVITKTDIQLFQILRHKPGEKEAGALVNFVDNKLKENNENNLKILATKEDIHLLKQDILQFEIKIAETKADMMKWLVNLFFVALMLAIIGLYFRK